MERIKRERKRYASFSLVRWVEGGLISIALESNTYDGTDDEFYGDLARRWTVGCTGLRTGDGVVR
jgi:hypothetical protein